MHLGSEWLVCTSYLITEMQISVYNVDGMKILAAPE